MKYQRHTPTLLALALATSLYGPAAMAQAQEPSSVDDANEQATDLDAVTVTGYRYAIEKSLEQKRNANAIVDVITAEDVSKFPDKNVADALQRVPGVIITRDGGEGHRVQVRGLQPDLTLTQLNGNYIASSETNDEASRSFNYALMPAHMLGSAELFKTPEARLDEGGIGGTVILHSRRPLDMEPNSGFVSAEGTYSDTSKTTDPQLSAMYSWHSEDNRFGFLVNATKQKRTNRSIGASTENWIWYSDDNSRPAVDVNGNALDPQPAKWWGGSGFNDQHGNHYSDFFMPTSVNFGIREEERERTGTQLTFQFRPTDDLTLTANYFRFDLQGDYVFNQLKIPEWNLARINWDGNWPGGRLLNGLTFDPSGTIVTGAEYEKIAGKQYYCSEAEAAAGGQAPGGWGPDDCTVPTPQLTGTYSREKTKSETFDIGMEWNAGDLLRISAKGGRTKSSGGPSMNFRMSAKPRRFVDGAWQAGNTYSAWDLSGTPTATFSPDLQEMLMSGIAEIDIGSTDSSWMETDLSQDYFQIDVTRLFETGWLESLQFGTKFRDGKVHRNTGNTYWVCQGEDPTDYDKRYQTGCDPEAGIAQSGFFLSRPITNIPGGFNANVFPGINYPAYIDHLNSRYGGAQRRREPDFIYDVSEEIHAGYLQANFRTDRLRGNLGVRVVRTNQKAQSTDSVERFLYLLEKDASGNLLPCDANNPPPGRQCQGGYVWADAREKTFALASLDKSYTDVLPSFNIAWDITYDLVLRGAASKTIARPAFSNIARPGGLQFYTEEYSNDRGVIGGSVNPGWYGNGSNKGLEPFEATQYDLGLEWYYQPGAVVGVGLFHKDVKNFTVPAVFDQQLDIDGETVTVQDFSTQVNGRDGISQGVEVFAQHSFDFGLGLQANYTYNKTNEAAVVLPDGREIGKSPLIGSAKTQANFTVFYETGKFLARASYNRRGEVVGGLHNGQNLYTEPYQQIDLNVGYNILENLALTGSVLNLTKEESRTHLGNDTKARLWSNGYSGRIYYLGLTYKF
ncbi:TonB-dependent receptor [Marilutibacter alkalisoli]|uniref:TonB-dependent receptor n=1 Tax=Marilutibacter alkalisoli TaxID=2591633 RepID=A0A514BWA5_9GAMM|nr:TonB-dependent receptor [Lysobacter alkalisoli]QDH71676.1 TonB-dependent receptor [Lysobacter alkalisoli]